MDKHPATSDQHPHQGFSSKIGFVLAAAGSAVGLGNIWRFPYLAAKYGGGIFLVTYLIVVLTFGYTLMISENALGRSTGKGPIGTFRQYCGKKTGFLKFIGIGGWLNAIAPLIVVPYYCVIGGWVTKYLVTMLTRDVSYFTGETSAQYFADFISSPTEATLFFLFFTGIMIATVAMGVQKGIERFNKVLMPILVILCIILSCYCCTLNGAQNGLNYYLYPHWSDFSYMTIVAAIGQAFFSLSLAMGISITYGSYMRKEDNLLSSVNQVECFDTGVAFLAGLMIIPAVIAFGGREAAQQAGPGLVFITLPQVFASFRGGQVIGILFFTLVLFAAATSAISLLETNVQTIGQELKINRRNSILLGMVEIIAVGIVTLLGYSTLKNFRPLSFISYCKGMNILDSLDFISNNIIMPLAAVFIVLLVMVVIGLEKFCSEAQRGNRWPRKWIYQFCISLLVIPCLLVVLLNSIGILH